MPGWSNPEPEIPPARAASPWQGGRRGRRRPTLRAVLLVLALWAAILALGLMPGRGFGLGVPPIPQMLGTALIVLCIALGRWSDTAMGAAQPGSWRLMWLPWLYLPFFVLAIVALGGIPGPVVVTLVALMIWVAVSEELMFRGLLFPALRRRMAIWPAIWISTLAFGALHMINGFLSGHFLPALVQSLAAVMTGLLLMAIRLRRGSIWPAILYHLLWNVGAFGVSIAENGGQTTLEGLTPELGLTGVLLPLAFVLPNGLYGLWLMRHAGRRPMPGDPGGV